jgi:hypothetical protein
VPHGVVNAVSAINCTPRRSLLRFELETYPIVKDSRHRRQVFTEQDQNVKRASPGRINKGHKPKATQPVLVCGLLNNGGLSAYRLQMSS